MAAAVSTCAPSKSTFDEDDDPDCEGILRANKTPGQSCKSSSDCALGAYRSTCFRQETGPSEEGVCIALKAPTEGDSCITSGVVPKADTTYASCGVDPTLQCDVESKACKKLVVKALGDACIGSGLECGSSAYCDSATKKCTARLKAGASCDPAATAACETRCDSDTKTCLTKRDPQEGLRGLPRLKASLRRNERRTDVPAEHRRRDAHALASRACNGGDRRRGLRRRVTARLPPQV